MLIKKPDDIPGNEITPKETYVNRRLFIRTAVVAGSVAATAGAYRYFNRSGRSDAPPRERLANIVKPGVDPNPAGGQGTANAAGTTGTPSYPAHIRKAFDTDEARTPIGDITHYNNFYEFSTGKEDVAAEAANFVTRPWTVEVTGLCAKPKTFDLAELLSWPQEERVYRMRCVEAWSMVIPWVGFPLSTLLNQVEPRSDAKYVRFETLFDPKRMPNQNADVLDWPYVEGLRMDEAMHPLTILATGIYGEAMPPQNGAPVRLVVPWKYGFKGIKSIVKVQLVADQPVSTWTKANASEYGFYSNVNPDVTHPRWSQASERRIGEYTRRPTLMFNGYGEQVAQLYAGMDLVKNY